MAAPVRVACARSMYGPLEARCKSQFGRWLAGLRVPVPQVARDVGGDGLQGQVFLEAGLAEVAAVAAALDAAPGGLHEAGLGAVDPHDAAAHGGRKPLAARLVLGDNGSRQPVHAVVGKADGLVLRLKRGAREHRPKHLLPPDCHVGAHAREDGGLHVVAARHVGRPLTAGEQRGALAAGALHVRHHLLVLRGGHQRAEAAVRLLRMAQLDGLRTRLEAAVEGRRQGGGHQHTRGGGADLAICPKGAKHRPLHRCVHVRVFKDHQRALPAQLQASRP
mmetsp:Transcript_5579/g.14486  ORF Transcript_5579/g.14486 Transcript_5579/m.14486 type:complete len:277 (+) Transcript_5579:42-872(+)